MIRDIWLDPVTKNKVPRWPCFHCEEGFFLLRESSSLVSWLSKSDSEAFGDWADAEDLSPLFMAEVHCINCSEKAVIAGIGKVFTDYECAGDGSSGSYHVTEFEVRSFYPSPKIISAPTSLLHSMFYEALQQSFGLFWMDESSCANKIRVAIEFLLDEDPFLVARTGKGRDGSDTIWSLHQRIKNLSDEFSELSESILSIKLLGNTGSHETAMDRRDLLDAYEILEYWLDEVYVRPSKRDAIGKMTSRLKFKHAPER